MRIDPCRIARYTAHRTDTTTSGRSKSVADQRREQDGREDFDFFIGRWKGRNRRLRARLKGSTDWEEFEGASVVRKALGGLANIDEVSFDRESGRLEGLTVRLFDPASQEWSIYW